jgi:hypothetical protein
MKTTKSRRFTGHGALNRKELKMFESLAGRKAELLRRRKNREKISGVPGMSFRKQKRRERRRIELRTRGIL